MRLGVSKATRRNLNTTVYRALSGTLPNSEGIFEPYGNRGQYRLVERDDDSKVVNLHPA